MIEDSSRTRDLIEELRADIDFELDDVLSAIVGSMPDDYFKRLKRRDQITHLKALLALSICQIKDEIMLRSDDGHQVAVIARQDYSGLLAKILKRLPSDQPLTGAKIFSSKSHDFIIDLFDFSSSQADEESNPIDADLIDSTIETVVQAIPSSRDVVEAFVSNYPPSSQVLLSPGDIKEHLLAHQELESSNSVSVRWTDRIKTTRVTIATKTHRARQVFQSAAEFMAAHDLDIEQAFLNDLVLKNEEHIAIASFVVAGDISDELKTGGALAEFLGRDV